MSNFQKIIKKLKDHENRIRALESGSAKGEERRSNNSTRVAKVKKMAKLHFGSNERNFIKTHGQNMGGAKKFTLLLAFLVKGKVGDEIALTEIETTWNRMKAKNLMGYRFNRKYSTEAKTEGWVNSGKHGFYHLLNGWMDIFKE